tara:strand:+ start:276 stop:554 length:279 start_codon:yes stop_codon:yes gene_type:complete
MVCNLCGAAPRYEPCKEFKFLNIYEVIMPKNGPVEFVRQVKSEAKKVTWPSRQETTVSMIAVFVMVFISSIFLYFADQIIAYGIRLIMGFGG